MEEGGINGRRKRINDVCVSVSPSVCPSVCVSVCVGR